MFSPIAMLVEVSGVYGQLSVPALPTYVPDQKADWTPGAPATSTRRGVFSTVTTAGIEVRADALFLIACQEEIDGLTSDSPTLVVAGKTWSLKQVDPRYYLGAFDGYNLHLAA